METRVMKKHIAIILALFTAIFFLAGCGSSEPAEKVYIEESEIDAALSDGDSYKGKYINIAGKVLNDQEINNAIFAGPFVSDAKKHFSKTKSGGARLGKDLVNGTPIRQDFLKKALEWMAEHETRGGHRQTIKGYMADRINSVYKSDADASEFPHRASQDNAQVKLMYERYYEKPLSHKAEEDLHTKWYDRSAGIKKLVAEGAYPNKREKEFKNNPYMYEDGYIPHIIKTYGHE